MGGLCSSYVNHPAWNHGPDLNLGKTKACFPQHKIFSVCFLCFFTPTQRARSSPFPSPPLSPWNKHFRAHITAPLPLTFPGRGQGWDTSCYLICSLTHSINCDLLNPLLARFPQKQILKKGHIVYLGDEQMITGNTAREVGSETGKENNRNKCITKQISTMGNRTLILQETLGVITPEGWGSGGIYVPIPDMLVEGSSQGALIFWHFWAALWVGGQRGSLLSEEALRQRNAGASSWKSGHPALKSLSPRGYDQRTKSIFFFFKHLVLFIYFYCILFL